MRYDEEEFEVWKGDESYTFANDGRNLFTCDVSDEIACEVCCIETVAENEKLYTKKEVEAAKRVRVYASSMGALSSANLILQVRSRRVEGIDFTVEDC